MKSDRKSVEIAGVWLPNKGAELMAHTVVTELGRRIPELTFWSQPQGDLDVRAQIGMPARLARAGTSWRKWISRLTRRPNRDERVVIDISGFAYGDHWTVHKAYNRAGKAVRQGRAVYLLPQAFGPFESVALAREMRRILRHVRLVAARDEISLRHLQELSTQARIDLLPDITVSLDVEGRRPERPDRKYGCLVLNRKTSDGGKLSETELIELYGRVATEYRRFDCEPIIVLHEPVADRAISEKLAERNGLRIVSHADARDTKRFLLGAECIVTGRYHGLVSGLSGGVPSFAVSWSHKYEELLNTYGCSDALYGSASAPANGGQNGTDQDRFIGEIAKILSDSAWREQYRGRLNAIAREQKTTLSQFWDVLANDLEDVLK